FVDRLVHEGRLGELVPGGTRLAYLRRYVHTVDRVLVGLVCVGRETPPRYGTEVIPLVVPAR
ncbi:hypothetical protein ACWC4J_44650, partial [Streptomyces sp. NPDC001356]